MTNLEGQISQTKALDEKLWKCRSPTRRKSRQNATKELQAYEARLAATSGLEAKYAELTHDITDAAREIQELQNKQQLTEQNGELLQRKAGKISMFSILPRCRFSPRSRTAGCM